MTGEIAFSPQELTGHSRAHIVEVHDPRCSLHYAVVRPFQALRAAAAADGLDLIALSSFRDFNRQLSIWNAKHRGERELRAADGSVLDARSLDDDARVRAILHWSALPGASRHHWGTDMDVIDANAVAADYRPQFISEEYADGGVFSRLNHWLAANAADYGFFRPYTSWRGGVQPEPWHLSHAPVAQRALAGFSVEVLRAALDGQDVAGRAAVERMLPEILERYVRNVDDPPAGTSTCVTRPA